MSVSQLYTECLHTGGPAYSWRHVAKLRVQSRCDELRRRAHRWTNVMKWLIGRWFAGIARHLPVMIPRMSVCIVFASGSAASSIILSLTWSRCPRLKIKPSCSVLNMLYGNIDSIPGCVSRRQHRDQRVNGAPSTPVNWMKLQATTERHGI